MARIKVTLNYTCLGAQGTATVYANDDEENLIRTNEKFRIQLVEKYNPRLAGKVLNAYLSGIKKE